MVASIISCQLGEGGGGRVMGVVLSVAWQLGMRQSALMKLSCLIGPCWLLGTGQQAFTPCFTTDMLAA